MLATQQYEISPDLLSVLHLLPTDNNTGAYPLTAKVVEMAATDGLSATATLSALQHLRQLGYAVAKRYGETDVGAAPYVGDDIHWCQSQLAVMEYRKTLH